MAETTNVTMHGFGNDPLPVVVPDKVNFGNVIIHKTKTIHVDVINNDARDFGNPQLVLNDPYGVFTCNGCNANFAFGNGASHSIDLSFTPDAVASFNAAVLNFVGGAFNLDSFIIDIDGKGIRPKIQYQEN
jgi:hypothetical protein